MNNSWWLANFLSRMLEPTEREAVQGDLVESQETGGKALREVLGLIVRRQAALWKDWRVWASLLGLNLPLSFLLSVVAKNTASQNATYFWLYVNNWDWALLHDLGFWDQFVQTLRLVFLSCLSLVCWAWTAGFIIGFFSQRIVRICASLFCLMLVFVPVFVAPAYLTYLVHQLHRPLRPGMNEPVELAVYRQLFPVIIQAVLVIVPALWGLSQSAKIRTVTPWLRVLMLVAATCAVSALIMKEPGIRWFVATSRTPNILQLAPLRLLNTLVFWPVGYLVVSAFWGRRRSSPGPDALG